MVQSLAEQNPQGAQQVIWHVPCSLKSCCYRFTLLVPCFAWATAVCGRRHCPICIMFSARHWNSRLYNVVSLATITSTQQKLLNFFQSEAYGRLGGSAVGVQRAQNTKSIFYLAENFSHGVVCPSAHRSQGQLFEHPSWACASSRDPSWSKTSSRHEEGGGEDRGGRWGTMSSPERWVK